MAIVERWLEENFDSHGTITNYRAHLKSFSEFVINNKDWKDFDEYINQIEVEEFYNDFTDFLENLKDSDLAPVTINHRMNTVREFMAEHGIELPEGDWKKLRRRKIPRNVPLTEDRAGSKKEWRGILNDLNLEGRSLVIFLLTSGCRVGEALQLKKPDIDFESDPPKARIRAEYTKNDMPRTVYFTEETKEEIQKWLNYREREGLKKKTRINLTKREKERLTEEEQEARLQSLRRMQGKFSESDRVWPIAERTAYDIFNRGLKKAGLNERDEETNRRKLHFHSCRKFYKTNLRGMDEDVVEYLMGHLSGIRGVYRKYRESDIPKKQYKERCHQLKILEPETGVNVETLRERDIGLIEDILESEGIAKEKIENAKVKFAFKIGQRLGPDRDVMMELSSSPAVPGSPFDRLDLGELKEEEFQELRQRLLGLLKEKSEPEQKLIHEDELEKHLADGWRYVDQNNSDKVIVEK